jgi:hypothetical protein
VDGDQGTAVIAGVAIALTVQTTLFVLWRLVRLRSEMRAERARLDASTTRATSAVGAIHPPSPVEVGSLKRRVRSLEMRLDSHVDRHLGRSAH